MNGIAPAGGNRTNRLNRLNDIMEYKAVDLDIESVRFPFHSSSCRYG